MAPTTPPPFDADELISVVVPLYNEQDSVRTLAGQIVDVMETHGFRYELILVNDGSADGTWGHIRALTAANPCIVGLDMAGNYGQTLRRRGCRSVRVLELLLPIVELAHQATTTRRQ